MATYNIRSVDDKGFYLYKGKNDDPLDALLTFQVRKGITRISGTDLTQTNIDLMFDVRTTFIQVNIAQIVICYNSIRAVIHLSDGTPGTSNLPEQVLSALFDIQ